MLLPLLELHFHHWSLLYHPLDPSASVSSHTQISASTTTYSS